LELGESSMKIGELVRWVPTDCLYLPRGGLGKVIEIKMDGTFLKIWFFDEDKPRWRPYNNQIERVETDESG